MQILIYAEVSPWKFLPWKYITNILEATSKTRTNGTRASLNIKTVWISSEVWSRRTWTSRKLRKKQGWSWMGNLNSMINFAEHINVCWFAIIILITEYQKSLDRMAVFSQVAGWQNSNFNKSSTSPYVFLALRDEANSRTLRKISQISNIAHFK